MASQDLYIAASSQHVGKTTCTLGLVSTLKEKGLNIGYCKPVGQEHLDYDSKQVDKDAVLFSRVMGFQIQPEIHSPIILGKGATSAFLDNPGDFHYEADLHRAFEQLHQRHDKIIFEGTGHPGVGSVVNLSNADVAKLTGAPLILVVEGGIGNTIDRINLCLALFREQQVPVQGIIINKVLPEKIEKVRHYVGGRLDLMGVPLLGILPFDKDLLNPILFTVMESVKGRAIHYGDRLSNRVEKYIAGSLVNWRELEYQQNLLLVVSHRRFRNALKKIISFTRIKGKGMNPLSGILLTGDGTHEFEMDIDSAGKNFLDDYQIPIITTAFDTLGSVIKISRIEVKINLETPWKIERAIELFRENVNLDLLLRRM